MPGHQWERTRATGEVAMFKHHAVLSLRKRHIGPRCTVCDFHFCGFCYPRGWERPCPGPPPQGLLWSWLGDGSATPPSEPELVTDGPWH